MQSKPEKQHEWLKQFVGSWEFEGACIMGPDQPPMKSTGTETVRMLGDLWIVAESQGTMPDGNTMTALLTLGFDPAKKKFVGTWVGSPMTALFVYDGELDAKEEVLPLNCTGPSWEDPAKTMQYQDIHEMRKDGTRLLRSQALGPDGKWMQFMSATYRKIK
jgi:hypothetical protein